MDNLPAFLDTRIAAIEPGSIDDPAAPYQPLIAIWLLEMALALGWYRRAQRDRAVDVFRNDFFRQCTGIPSSGEGGDDQDENVPEFLRKPRTRRVADATLARQLTQALAKARRQPLAPDLPLFRNVELLGGLLGLNDAEKAIVTYFVTLQAFHPFLEIVSAQDSKLNRASVIRLLSTLLGRPDAEIAAALHEEATLSTARILWLDWDHDCLDGQMNLISGLAAAMLAPSATAAELADRFLKRTAAPALDCAAFPHLARDIATVTGYLSGVLRDRTRGSNILFYGPAGTGKTELARHIADAIGKPMLVRRASDILSMCVGGSEKNIARMFADARQQDAVLVLDEADSFLADRRGAQHSWEVTQVNELLTQMEAFDGVFVCTTNLMAALDPASLRRFAFKVKFDYLNADQRWRMFVGELARLGGDVGQAGDRETPVRRLERVTPGDFAVVARQVELWGVAPSASELYEHLRKECEVKAGSVRSIGFAA